LYLHAAAPRTKLYSGWITLYERTVELLTLARVLIAEGRRHPESGAIDAAHTILERLRQEAEANGRRGSLIEILALTALADAAAGQRDQAVRVLQQALRLAAPEGYARIFLDEGAPMRVLLAECRWHIANQQHSTGTGDVPSLLIYIVELLAAFGDARCAIYDLRDDATPIVNMVEALSDRELEVLHLIADGASNQAIAEQLVISIGTVKSHINHILGKLAARNRTEAVSRARELGLPLI
jgi:LuxR family maltose regulon positive regulatory protein